MTASDSGDTAWMLVSTGFVLMMMPGLAFFEAGLLRSKNTVSILVQVFSGLSLLSFLWCSVGFTLVFGKDVGGLGIIGHPVKHLFLADVPTQPPMKGIPEVANNIPPYLFVAFQNMFASITPILVTGAVAERIKYSSFIIFIILWEFLTYYPLAHWIWSEEGWLARYGVKDFAGGIVIHASSGTAALVLCTILGHRHGWPSKDEAVRVPHHSLPLAAIGGCMLWLGWFSFNGGSAYGANDAAAVAVINSHVAASTACIVSVLFACTTHNRKPTFISTINGAIAGLAGITPCAGYIDTPWAFAVGALLGVSYHLTAHVIAEHFHIDDALEVSSVHGVTGIIGSLATGVLANNDNMPTAPVGALHGNPRQIWIQLVGVLVSMALSAVVTILIGLMLHYSPLGLKATTQEEQAGLDMTYHGERAYNIDNTTAASIRDALFSNDHPDESSGIDNESAPLMGPSDSALTPRSQATVCLVDVAFQPPELISIIVPGGASPQSSPRPGGVMSEVLHHTSIN